MVDVLPFPRILGDTSEKQIKELVDYLILFKETLEFALMNISIENLSPDLINKLNELGADIQKINQNREEEIPQISSTSTLTISDVCNSDLFKSEVDKRIYGLSFYINYQTGNLEFSTK